MSATLSPTWEISTDHAGSSYDQPVLVNRGTGEAYGPGDIVMLDPSHGFTQAAKAVRQLARMATLDAEGAALVARLVGSVPPR